MPIVCKSSVMTWRSIAYNGVGSFAFVFGKMNSQTYQYALRSHIFQMDKFLAGKNLKFQPDNAPTHSTSNSPKFWFIVNYIETLKWPTEPPDLSPIKNL